MAQNTRGIRLQIDNGSDEYTDVAEVVGFSGPSLTREMIESTVMSATWRTFVPGLIDGGELTIDVQWDADEATHEQFCTDMAAGTERAFAIHWSDYGTGLTVTAEESDEKWKTASAHGLETGYPVKLSTTVTLPTTDPQVVADTIYYVEKIDADEVYLYLTSAAAVAGSSKITVSGAGTGTHTLSRSKRFNFSAQIVGISPAATLGGIQTATLTLKVTGANSVT